MIKPDWDMIKPIKPDWDIFKIRSDKNPQDNFEWFCFLLFCKEFNKPFGIFRYKNQSAIETDPIEKDNEIIGWQAKFYDTALSRHKKNLISSIKRAKRDYPKISKIIFYTNQEWGQNQGKDPKGKIESEDEAKRLGIKLEWKTASFFESPFVSIENKNISQGFFTLDKSIDIGTSHQIKSLLPIQKALAAQSDMESNRLLYGRIFWPEVNELYKRDECERILQLFEISNVVILEGHPASGKSSIACRLAWDLVKNDKHVYYANLTTRIGLKCSPEDLFKSLLDECEKLEEEAFIIIEDIHHSLEDYNCLNPIVQYNHIKLLLTSRSLKRSNVADHFMIKSVGEADIAEPFQWLSPTNRIRIKIDQETVKNILVQMEASFNTIEPIMEKIGKDEPNLLFLCYLIQASSEKNLKVDEIDTSEFLDFLQRYLTKLAERVCEPNSDKTSFWKLLESISVLSEFEIPVEKEFLDIHFDNKNSSSQILIQMEKQKEVIRFQKLPGYKEFYIIPHSILASLYRKATVRDEERLNIIIGYISKGIFFGKLTSRLLDRTQQIFMSVVKGFKPPMIFEQGDYEFWKGDLELLEKVIDKFRAELIQRDLSQAEINEIWHFLMALSFPKLGLRKEIINGQRKSLISKDLSREKIEDISNFLFAISDCEGNKEIVTAHMDILKNKDLSNMEYEDIGIFLYTLGNIDKNIACEVLDIHRYTIEQKFSSANLEEFGALLTSISIFNEELGKEIIASNRDNLNRYLYDSFLDNIAWFISRISSSNQVTASNILNSHTDVIKNKLSQASLKEIGKFLHSQSDLGSENTAVEIAKIHADVLGMKFSQASLKEIRKFLDEVNLGSENIAVEIAKIHADVLGMKFSQASLGDKGAFLEGIWLVNNKVYREIHTRHKAILNQELSNAKLEHIENFVCLMSQGKSSRYEHGGDIAEIISERKKERKIIKRIVNEVLGVHKDVMAHKLSQGGLREIGKFLVTVKRSNKMFASEIVCIHKDILKNKDFSEAFILDISVFLAGICQADDDMTEEIIGSYGDALNKKIVQSTFDDSRLIQLGMFFSEISFSSKKLAGIIVNSSEDILKRKDISQSFEGTIAMFLAGISAANKKIAIDIADNYYDVLNQKFLQMDLKNTKWFFETIEKGDKDFVNHIINILRNSIRQKLSEKSLDTIKIFIKETSQACKQVPKKIVDNLEDILEQKISMASIRGTKNFMEEIYGADKDLAKKIFDSLEETLSHKDLSQTSILEIGWYLRHISNYNKKFAGSFVKNNKNIIVSREMSRCSIDVIGWFLEGICSANKEIANEVSKIHGDVLKNKDISQSDIGEIAIFLRGINLCDKALANEIIYIQGDILREKLFHANPALIAEFLLCYNDIAGEIIKVDTDILKNKDLSQVGLEDIMRFIEAISTSDIKLAKEINNMNTDIIKEKFSRVTIKEIEEFVKQICWRSKDVGSEIVNSQKNSLAQKLQKESLEGIKNFLNEINETDNYIACKMVDAQAAVIAQKLDEATRDEALEFLSESYNLDLIIGKINIFKKIKQNHSQILERKGIY